MNKLYWLDQITHQWKLVAESQNESEIMGQAARHLAVSVHGVVGYAKYVIKSLPHDYAYWTEYTRYEGGSKRSNIDYEAVPKLIRLLELL